MSQNALTVACVLDVAQTASSFFAHVQLEGDVILNPGDEVVVNGPPLAIAFGESFTEHRTATIRRAGAMKRIWTRATSMFGLFHLFDVSFTSRRLT